MRAENMLTLPTKRLSIFEPDGNQHFKLAQASLIPTKEARIADSKTSPLILWHIFQLVAAKRCYGTPANLPGIVTETNSHLM